VPCVLLIDYPNRDRLIIFFRYYDSKNLFDDKVRSTVMCKILIAKMKM